MRASAASARACAAPPAKPPCRVIHAARSGGDDAQPATITARNPRMKTHEIARRTADPAQEPCQHPFPSFAAHHLRKAHPYRAVLLRTHAVEQQNKCIRAIALAILLDHPRRFFLTSRRHARPPSHHRQSHRDRDAADHHPLRLPGRRRHRLRIHDPDACGRFLLDAVLRGPSRDGTSLHVPAKRFT